METFCAIHKIRLEQVGKDTKRIFLQCISCLNVQKRYAQLKNRDSPFEWNLADLGK